MRVRQRQAFIGLWGSPGALRGLGGEVGGERGSRQPRGVFLGSGGSGWREGVVESSLMRHQLCLFRSVFVTSGGLCDWESKGMPEVCDTSKPSNIRAGLHVECRMQVLD